MKRTRIKHLTTSYLYPPITIYSVSTICQVLSTQDFWTESLSSDLKKRVKAEDFLLFKFMKKKT